jgi:CHAD domain-containing protein
MRKSRNSHLKKKDPTIRLAYQCLSEQFEAMLSIEPMAREGSEAEGVHKMRVATRRLRAANWVFKSVLPADSRTRFNGEFKWLARVLGTVRDLDVYRANLRGYLGEIPVEDARCVDDYQQQVATQWQAARKNLLDCLSGERYLRLKSEFAEFLNHGLAVSASPGNGGPNNGGPAIRDTAQRLIDKQYKRVLRHGRSINRESPDEDLHALRIESKRLRYLFEFFQKTYGTSLDSFIKPLRKLQNVLGELQDAHVATEQLLKHADRVPMLDENRRQLLTLGQLIAGQRACASHRRLQFHKVWKRFDRRGARKKLRDVLK